MHEIQFLQMLGLEIFQTSNDTALGYIFKKKSLKGKCYSDANYLM